MRLTRAAVALVVGVCAGVAVDDTVGAISSLQLPTFYHDGNDGAAAIRGCTGAVVAPRFVLTTATCATRYRIARVSLARSGRTNNVSLMAAAVTDVVTHPRYDPAGPSRFDVALLELATPLLSTPLTLDFAPALVGDRLVRVSSRDDQSVSVGVNAVSLSECLDDSDLVTLPSDAADGSLVCVSRGPEAAVPASDSSTSILVVESSPTPLLSGFELLRKVCIGSNDNTAPCSSRVFVSMRGVANFINAFADGQLWGSHVEEPVGSTPAPTTFEPTLEEPTPTQVPTPTSKTSYLPTDEPLVPLPTPRPTPSAPTPPLPPTPAPITLYPTPTAPHSAYPYVASLHVTKRGKRFCGGVLVGAYHVVTAAHCVEDGLVKFVSLGSASDNDNAVQMLGVARVTLHPQYEASPLRFDVAVLELTNFAASSRFVELDAATDYVDQTAATLVSAGGGSGAVTFSAAVTTRQLPIWTRRKCEAQFAVVSDSVLCAGGDNGVDACSGDSGSPLIRRRVGADASANTDVLVGLVSAGFGCGQAGVPGFYTRVARVADFVSQFTILAVPAPVAAPSPLPMSPKSSASPAGPGAGARGSTTSPVIAFGSTTTPYPSSLRSERLGSDVASPIVMTKALAFIAGDAADAVVSRELWRGLVDSTNAVVLYSTGDLHGVVLAIERRSALPLNQRVDRFGSFSLVDGDWSSA